MRVILLITFALLFLSCSEKPAVVKKEAPAKAVNPRFVLVKNVKSGFLKYPHHVIIFLPPSYLEASNTNRYPVLYAHDGQNLFDPKTAFGGNEWKLDETLDRLYQKGLAREVIVVGVYNNSMRIDEYTPHPAWVRMTGATNGGLLTDYARFLVEELKPYIDSNYRTLTGPADTAVMGSSLGGLASFYLLGTRPDTFGAAFCFSSSFWWKDRAVLKDIRTMRFSSSARLYIDGGYNEEAGGVWADNRMVLSELESKGFNMSNLYYCEEMAGAHNEASWARRMPIPLQWHYGRGFAPTNFQMWSGPVPSGVGDMMFVQKTELGDNGMFRTLHNPRIIISNTALCDYNTRTGIVTVKKAGRQVIILPLPDGTAYAQVTDFMELGRNQYRCRVETASPETVDAMVLTWILEGRTNTAALTMDGGTNGTAEIILDKGKNMVYFITDGRGRRAGLGAVKARENTTVPDGRKIWKIKVADWK